MIETIKNISVIMEYIAFWVWFLSIGNTTGIKKVIHYIGFNSLIGFALLGFGCIIIQLITL